MAIQRLNRLLVALALAVTACREPTDPDRTATQGRPSLAEAAAAACTVCVLGPVSFKVTDRGTTPYTKEFTVADPAADHLLVVTDDGRGTTDAEVKLNGVRLVAKGQLLGTPTQIRVAVPAGVLKARTVLAISVFGASGSQVTVELRSGTKPVGPGGGTVRAPGGAVVLTIPGGALSSSTEISIAPSPSSPSDAWSVPASSFDFSPSGLAFAQPVTVTMAYNPATVPGRGREVGSLRVFTLVGSDWQEVPGSAVNLGTRTVSVPIAHFSQYQLQVSVGGTPTLAAGQNFSCAVDLNSQAACWGRNAFGALGDGTRFDRSTAGLVSGVPQFVAVTAGRQHACGLTSAGTTFCWGNDGGRLGNGSTAPGVVTTPVQVNGPAFRVISSSWDHTCALTTTGAAYCWGDNTFGQLGNGTMVTSGSPVAVATNLAFTEIGTGIAFSCGLATSGQVYCWGDNGNGEFGNGTTTSMPTPTLGANGMTFSHLSDGVSHACGLTTTGDMYCWGDNFNGQLGNGQTSVTPGFEVSPVLVLGGHLWRSMAGGFGRTCAIDRFGAAFCWGDRNFGPLGDGVTGANPRFVTQPAPVIGGLTFLRLTNSLHACGVTTSGQVACFGFNSYGEMGNGLSGYRATPTQVLGGVKFSSGGNFVSGSGHTCGVDFQVSGFGQIYCWGDNSTGQLGDGTITDRDQPVRVSQGSLTLAAPVAGSRHTCAFDPNSVMYCWGDNTFGQLGLGTLGGTVTTPTAVNTSLSLHSVVAGVDYTCGIERATNLAYCWGLNGSGQLGSGTLTAPQATPVAVAGGLQFVMLTASLTASSSTAGSTCGLTTTQTVYCWGRLNRSVFLLQPPYVTASPQLYAGTAGRIGSIFGGGIFNLCGMPVAGGPAECQVSLTGFASPLTPINGSQTFMAWFRGAFPCAITSSLVGYCWNTDVPGNGTSVADFTNTPIALPGTMFNLAAGGDHACGVDTARNAVCWGNNRHGAIGDGRMSDAIAAAPVFVQ